jgi:hypothetical protein
MPPRLLALYMTPREMAEVELFGEFETLDPEGWEQTGKLLSEWRGQFKGDGEKLDDPRTFLPVAEWPEVWPPPPEDDEE